MRVRPDAPSVVGVIQESVAQGFSTAMWISTAVLAVGAIYVGARTPKHIAPIENQVDLRATGQPSSSAKANSQS